MTSTLQQKNDFTIDLQVIRLDTDASKLCVFTNA
jgi:hypothetical protein